jgi:hypothetical protein
LLGHSVCPRRRFFPLLFQWMDVHPRVGHCVFLVPASSRIAQFWGTVGFNKWCEARKAETFQKPQWKQRKMEAKGIVLWTLDCGVECGEWTRGGFPQVLGEYLIVKNIKTSCIKVSHKSEKNNWFKRLQGKSTTESPLLWKG